MPININSVIVLLCIRSVNVVKKTFCFKTCSDLVKKFQILSLQPQISKFFSITRTIFLTEGQNNFGNKIPCDFFHYSVIGSFLG